MFSGSGSSKNAETIVGQPYIAHIDRCKLFYRFKMPFSSKKLIRNNPLTQKQRLCELLSPPTSEGREDLADNSYL